MMMTKFATQLTRSQGKRRVCRVACFGWYSQPRKSVSGGHSWCQSLDAASSTKRSAAHELLASLPWVQSELL